MIMEYLNGTLIYLVSLQLKTQLRGECNGDDCKEKKCTGTGL